MDASNLLKPALARGELHCIGATTLDEYRKHVEKDAALARRFQPVFVGEPSVEDTISILRGLKDKYEAASQACASPTARIGRRGDAVEPLHHRPLPARQGDRPGRRGGRAAAACRSIPSPRSSTILDREIVRLKIEQEALKKGERRRLEGAAEAAGEGAGRLEEKADATHREAGRRRRTSSRTRRSSRASSIKLRERARRMRTRRGEYQRAGELAIRPHPEARKEAEGRSRSQRRASGAGRGGRDRRAISRRWCRAGPAFRSTGCWKASARSCCKMEEQLAQARGRPGGSGAGGVDRGAPRARRPAGPEPADRLVHVPGPDRRRQDRTDQGARGIPVRRRARAGSHRHVGIHGEAFGRPPDRRASRLCRL